MMNDEARKRWLGKPELKKEEIDGNPFLHSAVKFADTALKHGCDIYGEEHTPLFANYLHADYLKSPRSKTLKTGTEPGPTVWSFFNDLQNFLKLLASLSLITGDEMYIGAAYDTTAYMLEKHRYPESGLLHWGGHAYIDLVSGNRYGMKGVVHEMEDVYPYWDLLFVIDPDKSEQLVKGMWEANILDWDALHYNRHGQLDKVVDFDATFKRTWNGYRDPEITDALSFSSVALDCANAAYSLGFIRDQEDPLVWADRFLNVFIRQRDPGTKIWPYIAYPQINHRGLNLYGNDYPQATEQHLYVGHITYVAASHLIGALGIVEVARKHGYSEGIKKVHQAVNENILGYLRCAYDSETHRMRHIINDGTDVTGYVFQGPFRLDKLYFGAKEGGAFISGAVSPLYSAVCARAYRLSKDEREFWSFARDLLKGAGLGDIGANPGDNPELNYRTKTMETSYVFALLDLYRATENGEYLDFGEHIGRNIISGRQHPESGLFTLEDDRLIIPAVYDTPEHRSPEAGKTVAEYLGRKHRIASLDAQEPVALLSLYAARIGRMDTMPHWVSGGVTGKNHSSGHLVSKQMEVWFDKPALQEFYRESGMNCTWDIDPKE